MIPARRNREARCYNRDTFGTPLAIVRRVPATTPNDAREFNLRSQFSVGT